jgi:glycosyltransferase involved in cell wall biosynthesis
MSDHEADRDLTIVVPVHDEKVEFGAILDQYGREFDQRGLSYEFVFVLDGTSDRLFDELRAELERRRPTGTSVRLIKFNQPFGESIALGSGFREARGKVVLSLPQYVQTDPHDVQKVLDAIDAGADVVTCNRKPRVDPWLNQLQSRFFNALMRMLTRTNVHDLNCLQRAMRRRVFEDVTVQGDMYRFLPVLAFRAGYEVARSRSATSRRTGAGARCSAPSSASASTSAGCSTSPRSSSSPASRASRCASSGSRGAASSASGCSPASCW